MVIIFAILAFGILIAVHELGHFFAAKAFGVKVEEFALGMGPAILKKQGKETLYTLRPLPIGGFCAMEGEDEAVDSPRSFSAQKPWKRAIILCAGAAMNFVVGFILVLCIAPMTAGFVEPVIDSFMDGCPYVGENAIMEGDRIYSVDGHRTFFTEHVTQYLRRSGGEHHDIVLIRDGHRVKLDDFYMVPVEYEQPDGSSIYKYGFYFSPREQGLWANIKYAWFGSLDFCRLVWDSLGMLVSGQVGIRDMSGPVGVVDLVNDMTKEAESTKEAAFDFCYIFALIAVNLAVMNMLPIPALDGGRVFFLIVTWIIEKISRRKLDPKYEGYIHTGAFVLLMAFMVFILFSDVLKAFFGV